MSQDKTADLLSALKNAYAAGRRETCLPLSKFNFAIVKILIEEGYLDDVKKQKAKTGAGKEMVITLNKLRQMKDKRSCQIIKNIKRKDNSSGPSLERSEELLKGTPNKKGRYVKVRAVFK